MFENVKSMDIVSSFKQKYVYLSIMFVCLVAHIFFMINFYKIGIPPMFRFNIISIVFYVVMLACALKEHYLLVSVCSYFEVMLHACTATVMVGWDYGFPLFLICILPIAFYVPMKRKIIPTLICVFTIATFVALKFYTHNPENIIYNVTDEVNRDFTYLFNSFTSFFMLIGLSIAYNLSQLRINHQLDLQNAVLQELANTDPLTNLLNRRSMLYNIKNAVAEGKTFALMLIDIDDFKAVNDKYGHDCGDVVLRNLAEIYADKSPKNSLICRWGGEEALIALPDTSEQSAIEIAEEIRMHISQSEISYHGSTVRVTVTVGVSEIVDSSSIDKAIIQADRRLYFGKRLGKNCVNVLER